MQNNKNAVSRRSVRCSLTDIDSEETEPAVLSRSPSMLASSGWPLPDVSRRPCDLQEAFCGAVAQGEDNGVEARPRTARDAQPAQAARVGTYLASTAALTE